MRNKREVILFGLILMILLAAGCSSAAPTPANTAVAATQAMVSPTAVVPTAQPSPTTAPTAVPTAEPIAVPTATAVPELAITAQNYWCLPIKAGTPPEIASAQALPNARPATEEQGQRTLLYANSVCVFAFTFNQPAPAGLHLDWFDNSTGGKPWISLPLKVDPQDPNTAFATANHTYIVDPPLWSISYKVELGDADNKVLSSETLALRKDWMPAECWNGLMPDFEKLTCRKMQDLHPWDAGYGWFKPTPSSGE